MSDVLTPEQRKRNMRSIKSKDTKIEIKLRKELWKRGYRYRKNYSKIPGKPDIVLIKYKIAIFCDSEFFHGKNWKELKEKLKESNNSEFWINKIEKNIERDQKVNSILEEMGWFVIRFWGKDIMNDSEKCLEYVEKIINQIKKENK